MPHINSSNFARGILIFVLIGIGIISSHGVALPCIAGGCSSSDSVAGTCCFRCKYLNKLNASNITKIKSNDTKIEIFNVELCAIVIVPKILT